MTIKKATKSYEKWLGDQMPLIAADLEFKHEQMAASSFQFFRATYYRWAQIWSEACEKVADAPEVLAVGDLHIENFGTWRDAEGRLVWGVNDFDEVAILPYTNDLIRLATSATLASREDSLSFDLQEACEAILTGFTKGLESKGRPFVLEEHHPDLREMATSSLRNPEAFWEKMKSLEAANGPEVPEAMTAIGTLLPEGCIYEVPRTRRAGLGSLSRPRYVVVAEYDGGLIAREAKRMAGSAVCWAEKQKGPYVVLYEQALQTSIRCNDPWVSLSGDWLVRRLAPHCTRISVADWPKERQELQLVEAMGFETANIHLGSKTAKSIRSDLKSRSKKWLRKATEAMAEQVHQDALGWRNR
jgi:hypothetical protein